MFAFNAQFPPQEADLGLENVSFSAVASTGFVLLSTNSHDL